MVFWLKRVADTIGASTLRFVGKGIYSMRNQSPRTITVGSLTAAFSVAVIWVMLRLLEATHAPPLLGFVVTLLTFGALMFLAGQVRRYTRQRQ